MIEERIVHNGVIQNEIPGVHTEQAPAGAELEPLARPASKSALGGSVPTPSDLEPEAIAGAMAKCIFELLAGESPPTPMDIVNGLLRLKSTSGHKLVWTRFDVHQAFAIWTKKLGQ